MINFMKYKPIFFGISLSFLIPGLIALFVWGLRPAIDFTGGALLEVSLTPKSNSMSVTATDITNYLNGINGVTINSVQRVGDTNSYIIRTNSINEDLKNQLMNKLEQNYDVVERKFDTVGPTLGRELLVKTGVAIALASMVILMYVAYQFKDMVYGVSAILAMFHDTLILLGSFAVLGHFMGVEVDMLFVTALLTTLSFSVHDTIVVFDRVREINRLVKGIPFEDVLNKSIISTFNRSLNNSMTIIFMLVALVVLGGDTIRWFAVALLIGTITGTYSSTFTAMPLLAVFMKKFRKIA